ncbi:MAG: hypothetical protein HY399_01175, partial [Elusimicrobia bacterium]|nr:hypothetical protein [Elusimicrobiota bacterium]
MNSHFLMKSLFYFGWTGLFFVLGIPCISGAGKDIQALIQDFRDNRKEVRREA